jgi:D-beta-D-heptose 7-phosphate kinase/D-beta-D-heptose 1-phosphate adenosyltransferase
VAGDLILDHYAWGAVDRVSPEAPIQILQVERDDYRLGGAGNVAANLAALGAQVTLLGRVGRDPEAQTLAGLLRKAGVAARLAGDGSRRTVVKTRFMAHDQQILRVDREQRGGSSATGDRRLQALARRALAQADLLLLSDYAKGTLDPAVLKPLLGEARRRGLTVVAGPKRALARYRGVTALSLNLAEASEAVGEPLRTPAAVARAGEILRRRLDLRALLITRGKEGLSCLWAGGRPFHAPARAKSVYDVTGAGDTVLATFALALANGAPPPQAAELANAAGSIVVGKLGAATVSRAELGAEMGVFPGKLKTLKTLLPELAEARRAGQRIVFTNGCFDLLHAGHVRLLEQARASGDRLVLGLNSDRSVRALKGAGRPLQDEGERTAILAGLASVDDIVIYDDPTPARLVALIRPEVLVKGGDYAGGVVVGRRQVEAEGGQVKLVPLLKGASSSRLIERIRALPESNGRPRKGFAASARVSP